METASSDVIIYLSGYEKAVPKGFGFFQTAADVSSGFVEVDHTYKSQYGKFPFISFSLFSSYANKKINKKVQSSVHEIQNMVFNKCVFAKKICCKDTGRLIDVHIINYIVSGIQLRSE